MAPRVYKTRDTGDPCDERTTQLPELFSNADWLALDIETTGLDQHIHTPVVCSIWDGNTAWVVDLRGQPVDTLRDWLTLLYNRLVVGHNLSFDLRFLNEHYQCGYPEQVWDTMIAERLLTAGNWKKPNGDHEWRTSLQATLERRQIAFLDKELQTSFVGEEEFTPEQREYATEDITHLSYLTDLQEVEIEKLALGQVAEIEMACVPIFAEIDRVGVTINQPKLKELIAAKTIERDALRDQVQAVLTPKLEWPRIEAEEAMQAELDAWNAAYTKAEQTAHTRWHELMQDYHHDFPLPQNWLPAWSDETLDKNDNKPKGLKRFVKYCLSTNEGQFRAEYPRPPKPKRDSAPINLGSDKQMLAAFAQMGMVLADYRGKTLAIAQLETQDEQLRQIIQWVLDYKKAQKLLDAFGESMLAKIGTDGRLRGNNNQIGTATGRPSGYDPNLYQMPRMRLYRECFVPAQGKLFVICDYSQMEMRIVAQLSGDTNLAKAFESRQDIHSYTARLMFGVEEPTKDQRHTAKIINFGILYGMGPKKMRTELAAKGVFMTLEQAYEAVRLWKASYPDAYQWIQEQGRLAVSQGYTQTPFGRKRFFGTVFETDQDKWAAARAGANHPVQGSNADCTKLAMASIHRLLSPIGATIVLQVYDEVVVEVAREYAAYAKDVVAACMKLAGGQVLKDIDCEVDAVVSTSWAEEDAIEI